MVESSLAHEGLELPDYGFDRARGMLEKGKLCRVVYSDTYKEALQACVEHIMATHLKRFGASQPPH